MRSTVSEKKRFSPFVIATLALIAVLGGLVFAVAAHAQSTGTFGGAVEMAHGYQSTTSTSSVLLRTLGQVEVDHFSVRRAGPVVRIRRGYAPQSILELTCLRPCAHTS
jgi:hypothetical protein